MDRALLLIAVGILVAFAPGLELGPVHARLATYLHGLLLEAFPWLLLGALVAATAEELLPDDLLPRLSRRMGRAAVPGTALLSPLLPMCECGIIAVVRGMIAKGLPAHLCITFLLAAPILNPIVLATTWLAFPDWRMVTLRAVCGFIVACAAGLLVARWAPAAVLCNPPAQGLAGVRIDLRTAVRMPMLAMSGTPSAVLALRKETARHGRAGRIARATLGHTLDIAAIFVLGATLAAVAKVLIPPEAVAAVGQGYVSGPLAGAGLAIGLSLCAETDAFLAASLHGMAMHALLCFLVVGPMLDLKLMLMYRGVFTGRMTLALVLGVPFASILLCLLAGLAW